MKSFLLLISTIVIAGCVSTPSTYKSIYPIKTTITIYKASYSLSLQVERPEKASKRYGPRKIDILNNDKKYKFYFEDELVRTMWSVTSHNIAFLLENKTDHSIKIPWDEAAYVDENGRSHRVMHSGIKYTDRDQPAPPSVVVRKGIIEDIVFPTDYVYWMSGSRYTAGNWMEKPLLLSSDSHGTYLQGDYPTFEAFDMAVKSNVGKTIQVLLPLQIEGVVNDYIFIFKIDSVSTAQETISSNDIFK